jgi:hypothetical protein
VKIADAVSGRPSRSFYILGGSTLEIEVPAGLFTLKYATGDRWCGDQELFGTSTEVSQTERTFRFDNDHGYKIDLVRRKNGNLPIKIINRDVF